MYIPCVCFLLLSTLGLSHALVTTPSLNPGSDASTLTALIAGLHNSTLSIPKTPEEFDVGYEIGGPKLQKTSCLMNTIAALKDLALGEWDGKIIDGTEYRLDNYPEVSIVVTTPRRQRNVPARFVTWAVCLGIYEIIAQKRWEFAQFEMLWERKVRGWVQIVNHPPRAGSTVEERQVSRALDLGNETSTTPTLPNENLTASKGPIDITDIITTDNPNDAAEARLNLTFTPYGDFLSIYDVFVPIMSGLTDMAQIPSTHECMALMVGLQGFKGFICVLPVVPLRTSPPVLTYGWLIRAISRIPTYMLGEGRFGEVTMKIVVDEVTVGWGRLSTAPDCNDDALLRASLGVAES